MAFGLDDEISRGAIEVVEVGDDFLLFRFPKTTTVIRAYYMEERGGYTAHTDHLIHTPEQFGPYRNNGCYDYGRPDIAIKEAVRSLSSFYEGAVKEGHQPSNQWIVAGSDRYSRRKRR
ncbi:hypothetical protein ACW7BJ_27360 [Azospirillum argentinense]